MDSPIKFSEDVVPLGDLKVNPGKVVRRVDETGWETGLDGAVLAEAAAMARAMREG